VTVTCRAQLANRGDRLVFSNGVIVLAAIASVLIVVFRGETDALIPLYAVGVFTAFSRCRSRDGQTPPPDTRAAWHGGRDQRHGFGAPRSFTIIFAVTKFGEGAWIPIIIIPVIVALSGHQPSLLERRGGPQSAVWSTSRGG